jgi:Fe-S-cluster-containing hydrogenase component 2
MTEIYERLASFLDELPAGYPRTTSGVELRILQKLFTPSEAELFLHLTLIGESPVVVAHRAARPVEEVELSLDEMENKGLVFATHKPGKPPEYSAQQFVIGVWEAQVNHLDRELVEAFEEYLPHLLDSEVWRKAPQLRTIPIGESLTAKMDVMSYERAEEIIRAQSFIAVANCICRQEMQIVDHGCSKPMETCMSFGSAAHYYVHSGRGRMISQEEAVQLLKLADETGLVLQPSNAKEPLSICACCGCCCGVLRSLKQNPAPALIASSPYYAAHDPVLCSGCGTCAERCQMDAISMNDTAELDQQRCIGCGLCVSTCPTGALILVRKPESEQPSVPENLLSAYIQLGQARGKLGKRELASMLIKSRKDRLVIKLQ